MAHARTTIIIPNWNGRAHLERLLPSLAAQTRAPGRVLVVDSASNDGSARFAEKYGDVLALGENRGFAFAVNRGIEECDSAFVAIVNNDTVFRPEALQNLEDALEEGNASYACPLLVRMNARNVADGGFDLMTRGACPYRGLAGEPLDDVSRPLAARMVRLPPLTATLVRREMFETVGLLEERFESYLEDVDLGLRAARQGLRGVFVPEAVVMHAGSATLGARSARVAYLNARNQLYLVARHYPRALLRKWWWPLLCGQSLYCLWAFRTGNFAAVMRGKWEALRHWNEIASEYHSAERDTPGHAESMETLIAALEQELAVYLASRQHPPTFWRAYYYLCGMGGLGAR